MKKILSVLLAVITAVSAFSCPACAEENFAQAHGFTIVRARAYDGLREATSVDLPEATGGVWSASMSQPAVTATLPAYDGRVTYEVVYVLRTGTKVEVPREMKRKGEWSAEVVPHQLLPIDAVTGRWIQETNAYIPYVTMPSRSDKNILTIGGQEIRVYYTTESETVVGEPEWNGLVQETPSIIRVSCTFNVPADYHGLLLAINRGETNQPSAAQEEAADSEVYPVFSDLEHLQDWEFIDVRESAVYETIEAGTFSESVTLLQHLLISAGYQKAGTADGSYGPLTVRAVSAVQEENGLPVTGDADSRTIHAILDKIF